MGGYARRRRDVNHINAFTKYIIFFFNFGFWLVGCILVGVGLYAFFEKWKGTGYSLVQNAQQIILDVSIIMMIVGFIVFSVSWAGCVGALRENSCLLKFYSACLLLFFLAELGLATIGFVFPQKVTGVIEKHLTNKLIERYREDADLQNIIDFTQQEFQCCGLSQNGYMDWSNNEYFNCTSSNPSVEKCAVPFSCCRNSSDLNTGLINIMCGYNAQQLSELEASKKIWINGCISTIEMWVYGNLYIIAGIAVGVALAQLFVIFLARTLEGQIQRQKSLWTH